MPRLFSLCGALMVLLFAAGCQETDSHAPLPPRSTIELVLNSGDRAVPRTLLPNTALKIILPAPAQGPSYVWAVLANNNRVLRQTSALAPLPGSPSGQYAATFQAIYPGRSVIRFAALKPGQVESEPKDIYEISVVVKRE